MGPGKYHGFPERPGQLPPNLIEQLRDRARAEGYEDEFDAWMAQEDL